VVMFVYNRPKHTEQALESLKKNKPAAQTVLYIYADGPKAGAGAADLQKISETRALVKKITGFKQVIVVEKENNEGLARSVISGVTEVVTKHGKIIVLEDDLLVSPYFLDYMNEALEMYRDAAHVYSVNGFMFPVKHKGPEVVLLPYTSTWGWATWKNKWDVFDEKMKGKELLLSDQKLADKFNLGEYNYTGMLDFKNNSWGIKWYYSVFMKNGLNLFPANSLVTNIGFDGSGTNCDDVPAPGNAPAANKIKVQYLEKMDPEFYRNYLRYFKQSKTRSLVKKTISYFKK